MPGSDSEPATRIACGVRAEGNGRKYKDCGSKMGRVVMFPVKSCAFQLFHLSPVKLKVLAACGGPAQSSSAVKCVPSQVVSPIKTTTPHWVFHGNALNTSMSIKSKRRGEGLSQWLQIRYIRGIITLIAFLKQLKNRIGAVSMGTTALQSF